MKRILLVALAVVATLPVGAHARSVLKGGDFQKPLKRKHNERMLPAGFDVVGPKKGVTRFIAEDPYAHAVALAPGSGLASTVDIPAAPKPDKVDPKLWYGVLSVDLVGLSKGGEGQVVLDVREAGKQRPLASETFPVLHRANRGDHAGASSVAQVRKRAWLRVAAKHLARLGKGPIHVRVRVEGNRRVVVDNLRFDLFHEAPSRPLVGKPNGKNGPDLLASGALGFLALAEHNATAFSLLQVRKGGPAAKAGLTVGDLVIAIGGEPLPPGSLAAGDTWFRQGHEAVLGRAIETALLRKRASLTLTVLRAKKRQDIEVKLPHRVGFAKSFPFEDAQAAQLRDEMTTWVAAHQKKNGFWPGNRAVNSCLAGLALLGTRNKKYKANLRKLVDALLDVHPTAKDVGGFSFWGIAFQGIFFAEYYLATGDKRVLAWMEDAIGWLPSTTHPSKWGMPAFGHSPKGLPYNDKALMAPCSHLLVFESLAERCGIKSKIWAHIKPYVIHSWSDPSKGGHGGMGYNGSYKDKAEFWSRSGLTALALHLHGRERRMQKALTTFMVSRHAFMLNSHAYGEPGAALGLAALATVHPKGFAEVMAAWRWRFVNAWEPGFGLRYSSPHMGSPYMGEEEIVNPSYAMLFSVLNKGLVMTGGTAKRWLR